jgi:hypothetical protein
MSIMAVAGLHLINLAYSSPPGGSDDSSAWINIVGYVVVPVLLAFIGATWALIKGGMRLTKYMTRTEATQSSIATTNSEIRDTLHTFIDKTDDHFARTEAHLAQHDQDIAVIYAVNGHAPAPSHGKHRLPEAEQHQHQETDCS